MRRIFTFVALVLCVSLAWSTGCKSKTDDASALEEETTDNADASNDEAEDAQVNDDAQAQDDDDEPVIQIDAPKEGLLGGQGLRDPQDAQEDSADDGGLKLQLGGGSGYGYQRSQPSLLGSD